ncbi:MAG: hypothetical protein IIU53_05175, partial [Rikenellaceae bacterium]|nr:hypothetical protein [Rikenellaceae bacterium]
MTGVDLNGARSRTQTVAGAGLFAIIFILFQICFEQFGALARGTQACDLALRSDTLASREGEADSFYTEGAFTLSVFSRVLSMQRFQTAFVNTVELGLLTGILSTAIGLLFAYVDVYVKLRYKVIEKLFQVVSLLPVVSPPFVLSLSTIMLFGRSGIISRSLLHIYDSNVYGLKGIVVVQTLTFFPVCYMMLKG